MIPKIFVDDDLAPSVVLNVDVAFYLTVAESYSSFCLRGVENPPQKAEHVRII